VKAIIRRLRKLEAGFTDVTGLRPHSPEWFDYWISKLEPMSTGHEPDLRDMTIEVLDAIRAMDNGADPELERQAHLPQSSGR
jgi:hypothetical protein